jgi:hypothetical protein
VISYERGKKSSGGLIIKKNGKPNKLKDSGSKNTHGPKQDGPNKLRSPMSQGDKPLF